MKPKALTTSYPQPTLQYPRFQSFSHFILEKLCEKNDGCMLHNKFTDENANTPTNLSISHKKTISIMPCCRRTFGKSNYLFTSGTFGTV